MKLITQGCGWLKQDVRAGVIFALCFFVLCAAWGQTSSSRWPALTNVVQRWDAVPLEQVQREADQGEPTAQHYLGVIYYEGRRVSRDATNSIKWFERAGAGGYAPAYHHLGVIYYRGGFVPKDPEKMLDYFRRASTAGHSQAAVNIGFAYRDGNGVPRDYVEAMKWFQQAATNGNLSAFVQIGRLYRFGNGVRRDEDEAIKWFMLGAAKEDALAEFNLALTYRDQGNAEAELKYLQLASEHGDTDAMCELHDVYERGRGVKKDVLVSERWLLKSAEAGNARAQCMLGYHHHHPSRAAGNRVGEADASMAEAVKWYQRSASQGWSPAQLFLAQCFMEGLGVEVDEARGLEFTRASADANNGKALLGLADLYARGIGEPRNAAETPLKLLQRVATNPNDYGQESADAAWDWLVGRYKYGIGTERDLVMAAAWYRLSDLTRDAPLNLDLETVVSTKSRSFRPSLLAGRKVSTVNSVGFQQGDPLAPVLSLYLKSSRPNDGESPLRIAQLYLQGRDVPRSSVQAWVWLTLAAERGTTAAPAQLEKLRVKMTTEELKMSRTELTELTARLRKVANELRR